MLNLLLFFVGYARSGKLIFQMAMESDTYYPIWGTCLGKHKNILSTFNHACINIIVVYIRLRVIDLPLK